tara:strand:+ start:2487 stop:2837 length:351 start_codon:yes stop_codon:yes gene_type:complete
MTTTVTFTPEKPYGARTENQDPVTCEVGYGEYDNGRISIVLTKDGEHYRTASINLPDYPIPKVGVFIKNYSETAGVLKALVDAGIVTETKITVPSGFVNIPLCLFTEKALNQKNDE